MMAVPALMFEWHVRHHDWPDVPLMDVLILPLPQHRRF